MSSIRFTTTLYTIGAYTIAHLPQDASAQLPSRGQVMVTGTIGSVPFQAALEPDGKSGHWLAVDSVLARLAGVAAGDTVTLQITATKNWPEPAVPADIQAGLAANPQTKHLWQGITPMARWEWIRWINSTANPATRQKRIEVSASKMLGGGRRPCCFNRSMCCVPEVSKNGVLLTSVG